MYLNAGSIVSISITYSPAANAIPVARSLGLTYASSYGGASITRVTETINVQLGSRIDDGQLRTNFANAYKRRGFFVLGVSAVQLFRR